MKCGEKSLPLLLVLLSVWLFCSASTLWADGPGTPSYPTPSDPPKSTNAPQLSPLMISALLVQNTRTLAAESTALAEESATLTQGLENDQKRLKELQTEADGLKNLRESLQTSLDNLTKSSGEAAYLGSQAITEVRDQLNKMTRSRDLWRYLAVGSAIVAVTGWVAFAVK